MINAGVAIGGLNTVSGPTVTSLIGWSANNKNTVADSLAAGATISLGGGNGVLLFPPNGYAPVAYKSLLNYYRRKDLMHRAISAFSHSFL